MLVSEAKPRAHPPRVVIVGAGLAGLTAAYRLAGQGYRVRLLESAPELGGLASSVALDGLPIERFYHFVCRADRELVGLARELGIGRKLHWKPTRTAFYHHGRMYPFGTPFDLLRFSPIPPAQRLRFGLHILTSRYRSVWKWLDQIPAKPWLIENIGEEAYDVIWSPLLRVKFGSYHEKISAAWLWHRIWRVAKSRPHLLAPESFGYFERGSQTVVAALQQRLAAQPNVAICTGSQARAIQVVDGQVVGVETVQGAYPAEMVLSTVPLPILDRLLPPGDDPYFEKLRRIRYIGVVCMMLVLKRPFSPYFWMNIHDEQISFNGIIEYTRLNQVYRRAGHNVVYIPFYVATDSPRYRCADEQLYREYLAALQRIKPTFKEADILEWRVFRTAHAQAVCTTNFLELVPAVRSPIKGLYVSDSAQFYPEDRSLSAAVRLGGRAAGQMQEDLPWPG